MTRRAYIRKGRGSGKWRFFVYDGNALVALNYLPTHAAALAAALYHVGLSESGTNPPPTEAP